MKPRKLTLISLALLATLLIGAGAVIVLSPKPVGANIKWDPKSITWDGIPPPTFNAQISLKGGYKAQTELNVSTLLLEGLYSPSGPHTNATHGPKILVPFSGSDVKAALSPKLPTHMGILIPGRYRIDLDLTGKLYTGETVEGSGVIVVTVPEGSG
jgi:hypothetical protein